MTIDTSREAVEWINEELSWNNSFGAIELINALLARAEAAETREQLAIRRKNSAETLLRTCRDAQKNVLNELNAAKSERDAALAEVARLTAAIEVKGGNEHAPTQWAYDRACEALHRAKAEVARLSTPPDDAEVRVLESWLRNPWSTAADNVERGPIPDWLYALMQQAADALTRLSNAIAAETAKREAMEEALTGLLEPFGDDPCRYDHHGKCQEHFIEDDCCVARARATIAKHGSK